MRLSRVSIENFRGIRRLDLDLDPVTVVVGENNHGKTSLFDVLALCLGRPGRDEGRRFRRHDFHRPRGESGPAEEIRIVLTLEADVGAVGDARIAGALTRRLDGSVCVRVGFRGRPPDGVIAASFLDCEGSPLDPQPPPDTLPALRRICPVLLVRFAHPFPSASAAESETEAEGGRLRVRHRAAAEIARVYHELVESRGPVSPQRLGRALRAARRAENHGPLREMLGSLLPEVDPEAAPPDPRTVGRRQQGGGNHTLGLLMVLGALLEVHAEESLSPGAHPLLAIEEPEAHLHPILLASTWDVIESLRAQTLITTNSGEFLSSVPLASLRRLARREDRIAVHRLDPASLDPTEERRVGFHIRAKRGGVLFARGWLLVEGESEFWLMRELARVLGYDLEAEGVRCVEFAQCGVAPLAKLANDLGIEWHLMTDGDESGGVYAREARGHLGGRGPDDRITTLDHRDVERCLWHHGFADLYREAAGLPRGDHDERGHNPGKVIAKAVRNRSKPFLAISAAEWAAARGPEAVPPVLRRVIEASVSLARDAIWEDH